jgi:hypothetical protein
VSGAVEEVGLNRRRWPRAPSLRGATRFAIRQAISPSLRGANATKQSIAPRKNSSRKDGLLRCARNDESAAPSGFNSQTASARSAFEVTSPRSSRGEVARRSASEAGRVRGSLRVHDAWRQPLTPPSPREEKRRGEGDERARRGEKRTPPRSRGTMRPSLAKLFAPGNPEGAGKAGRLVHPRPRVQV